MSKTFHMCYCIQGVLRYSDKQLTAMFQGDDGQRLPAGMIRDQLKMWLLDGRKVMPLAEQPCEGFCYQHGCPGHETLTAREVFEREAATILD